jgi:hypothetical protein
MAFGTRGVWLVVLTGCLEVDGGSDTGGGDTGTDPSSPGDDDDDVDPTGDDDDDDEGWVAFPLLDDGDIWHSGNDLVTGIHFRDLEEGVVVTSSDNQTVLYSGAVFGAARREITDIRFAGPGDCTESLD